MEKDDVIAIAEQLINAEKAVAGSQFKDVEITREGNQIILPNGMGYNTAIEWLGRKRDDEETIVSIHHEFPCFPLEGLVAFKKAMDKIFGYVGLRTDTTMFGQKIRPVMVSVEIAPGKYMQVPYGKIEPPTLEGGYLQTGMDTYSAIPKFILGGEVKKKFESSINKIAEMIRTIMKEDSIYKGKAIRVDLEFMRDPDKEFNPTDDAPKYMDLSKVSEDDLILKEHTKLSLATSIFLRVEKTEDCVKQGIPLKHGVLLMGPYGTGKTLTAKVSAVKAVANNWTFIYLENCRDLANALRMAEQYAPAVIFAEDIDKAVEGNRSESLNKILNTLDGIDTKSKPIITVLTTNHPENINKAFLRAGRIDTAISMQGVDAKAGIEFIKKYMVDDAGKDLLIKSVNFKKIGEALDGLVPAFIAEIINKAKMHAVYRHGANIVGKVTDKDIVVAAEAIKEHIDMVEENNTDKKQRKLTEITEELNDVVG